METIDVSDYTNNNWNGVQTILSCTLQVLFYLLRYLKTLWVYVWKLKGFAVLLSAMYHGNYDNPLSDSQLQATSSFVTEYAIKLC